MKEGPGKMHLEIKEEKPEPGENGFTAAEARAQSIIERAKLNEALKTIQQLENEVAKMNISPRFGNEKVVPKDKTGEEFKRERLLRHLESIKANVAAIASQLHTVVLDIEASRH